MGLTKSTVTKGDIMNKCVELFLKGTMEDRLSARKSCLPSLEFGVSWKCLNYSKLVRLFWMIVLQEVSVMNNNMK